MGRYVAFTLISLFVITLLCVSLLIENVKATSWNWFPSPTITQLNSVDMVSTSDGWAVGHSGTILRWDGAKWNTVTSPTKTRLDSVGMVSASDGWAVGQSGTILRWDGANWNNVTSPTTNWLFSISMLSANTGWAVGQSGTILQWNGVYWNMVTSPATWPYLYAVDMFSANDGWAVGYRGTTFHWDGTNWSNVTSITTNYLYAVDMVSSTDAWAVGYGGTILHWDGISWNWFPSPTTEELTGLSMTSATDGWAVGDNGCILQWNGSNWNTVTSPTTNQIYSVNMVSASDAWAVGQYGRIYRYSEVAPEVIPPIAFFSNSPEFPKMSEVVTFDASGSSDPDGIIDNYFWGFGDGNTATGMTTTHTYGSFGTYNVTLTVTDNEGYNDVFGRTINIPEPNGSDIDTTDPIAIAGEDLTCEPGKPVTFDASGSNDNTGITSYEWLFGDGKTGTGITETHTYTNEDTYIVTLTVTDAAGNRGVDYLEITIREAATPFPLWVLAPIILGVTGISAFFVYRKRKKHKEEVTKTVEHIIAPEPTEFRVPARKTEEVIRPIEEISPQKEKESPKLNAKCVDTIALLNDFIEDPSRIKDRKAWKGFREFINIAEQIEDEYAELIEIRNDIAILRRKRNEYRRAGLDDLADKVEGDIQDNYVDSIRTIKEIQKKLPKLGG